MAAVQRQIGDRWVTVVRPGPHAVDDLDILSVAHPDERYRLLSVDVNARFWDWCSGGGGFAKITLRPGQTLTRTVGGFRDEGFWRVAESWEHVGDGVRYTCCEDGRDCDGRYERGLEVWCPLAELGAVLADPESMVPDAPPRPNWRTQSSDQRDYTAEAAGY